MTKTQCAGERSPVRTKDHISLVWSNRDENTWLIHSYFSPLFSVCRGKPVNHPSTLNVLCLVPKLYQRSVLCSKHTPNKLVRSFLTQYKIRRQKKIFKGRESRKEEKTKDTALYYTLPNYLYALIINRENFTLFSYNNFKFRQKIKCYK